MRRWEWSVSAVLRARRLRHYETFELDSVELSEGVVNGADCVLIATDHGAYDYDWIVRNARLVVDSRNAARSVVHDRQKIVKA